MVDVQTALVEAAINVTGTNPYQDASLCDVLRKDVLRADSWEEIYEHADAHIKTNADLANFFSDVIDFQHLLDTRELTAILTDRPCVY